MTSGSGSDFLHELINRIGTIDFLVNDSTVQPLLKTEIKQFKDIIQDNHSLMKQFLTHYHLSPAMKGYK